MMRISFGLMLLFAFVSSFADASARAECAFEAAKKIAIESVHAQACKENPLNAGKTVTHLSAIRGMMSSSGGEVTFFLTAIRNYRDHSMRHRMIAHVVVDGSCKIKSQRIMAANSSFALATLDDADKESQE